MFDQDKADRAVRFIKNLKHTQGDWGQKPFNLLPWQEKIVRDLFGTVNEDGTRQYREAYISMARKNGKSELTAAIANYCLFADSEYGAEIYVCAGDREQASKVFNASADMVRMEPTLFANSNIIASQKRIVYPKRNSFYRVISSESFSKFGYNPHVVIYDELHVAPNRLLYDVMKTGMGARKQPLMINLTTAGYNRQSLCWEIYDLAKKIQAGIQEDPTFYFAIFEADENDDWKDEKIWHKANPALGVFREYKEFKDSFNRALQMPSFENEFKRDYLNLWTCQEIRLIPMDKWDACPNIIDTEELKGRPCYGGLDLAKTVDITSFVLYFPPESDDEDHKFLSFFWLPRDDLVGRSRRDRVEYDVWVRNKLIFDTPGDQIDYSFILQTIKILSSIYTIQEIGYDRHGAGLLQQQLTEEGFKMVPIGQGYASMSPPTKEMVSLIYIKKLNHGGNKVLRWMADNVAGLQDPAGNLKPDKGKSREKIDGIVALIMALDRGLRNASPKSILDENELQFLAIEKIIKGESKEKEEKEEILPEPEVQYVVENPMSRCPRCSIILHGEEFCPSCSRKVDIGAQI